MSKFARSVRLSIKSLYIRIECTCTSEENTLLVSRVRYAFAKRCTVRGYPLRDFHSAAIVINIRVLRASRTDRRRDPAYVKRDSTSGTHPARRLFTPVAASSASSPPPAPPPKGGKPRRDRILAAMTISLHAPRETLSSTRRANFSTAKLARRREGREREKEKQGISTIKVAR
ncbi:hypothetical protein ACS0PU_002333 [Formica fusca]